MKTQSPDTSLKAEKFHIALIRKAPIFKRLQLVNSLVKTTWQLSWMGISNRYRYEKPEMQIKLFISLLYNNESYIQHIQDIIQRKNAKNEAP